MAKWRPDQSPGSTRLTETSLDWHPDLAVVVAIDGLEGVRFATARRPALVVLDMSLPGLDGVGVGEALRSRYGAGLPILVVTAGGGAAEKSRRIAAFAYLNKPFDMHLFLARVREGLELRPVRQV